MRTVDELIERVRQQGGKATSQRILIWSALAEDKTHPTAEDLYHRLKPALPSLSLTTLYHTLNELVEWGEIRRFDAGDGHIHFDPDTSGHAELVCLRCYKVIDAPAGTTLAHRIPADIAGFAVVMHSEQYFGYCALCQQTLREQPTSAPTRAPTRAPARAPARAPTRAAIAARERSR